MQRPMTEAELNDASGVGLHEGQGGEGRRSTMVSEIQRGQLRRGYGGGYESSVSIGRLLVEREMT